MQRPVLPKQLSQVLPKQPQVLAKQSTQVLSPSKAIVATFQSNQTATGPSEANAIAITTKQLPLSRSSVVLFPISSKLLSGSSASSASSPWPISPPVSSISECSEKEQIPLQNLLAPWLTADEP
jgi:hypothetical protein